FEAEIMVAYRVLLENDDNDTLLVTCPDIPGVVTYGETREAALHHAVDAIETMLASLICRGAPVPRPKRGQRLRNNEALVKLPILAAAKLELYWALKDAGITRAELMRRLDWKREWSIGCSGLITRPGSIRSRRPLGHLESHSTCGLKSQRNR